VSWPTAAVIIAVIVCFTAILCMALWASRTHVTYTETTRKGGEEE